MKRKIITLVGIMCAILALAACAGTPMVFDDDVPAEKSAHFIFLPGIEITSYNGIPVPVKETPMSLSGKSSEWRNMILPAGETEFTMDIGVNYGNTIYRAKDVSIKYTFAPSVDEMYILRFTSGGGDKNDTWGINIFKSKKVKLENKIAFIPFPRSNRTVLQ